MMMFNLSPDDLYTITLAADARFGQPDYTNDHVWEITLGTGEPPALAVQTTYGLRARAMRIFPRFSLGLDSITDPGKFANPPRLVQNYPNFVRIDYSPFSGLDVQSSTWVPDSHSLVGRLVLSNTSVIPIKVTVELAILLSPLGTGLGMKPVQENSHLCLQGQTSGLFPVLCLDGNALPGTAAFPSLASEVPLSPGGSFTIQWGLATEENLAASVDKARQLILSSWEPAIARIQRQNAHDWVEIECEAVGWNAVFSFSQQLAQSLMMGEGQCLPAASYILSRRPDQGYSRRGDGADYNELWSGLTPLEAWYLLGFLLPGQPHRAQGLIRNFLSVQDEEGSIDCQPGLAGQRMHRLATPLLACLAWRIFQTDNDKGFLKDIFPQLVRFAETWFSPKYDLDGDNFPEWASAAQMGLDGLMTGLNVSKAHWASDLGTLESPALAALLLREIASLEHIAHQVGAEMPRDLARKATELRKQVETCWDAASLRYCYRDRDTHLSGGSECLSKWQGSGTIQLQRTFLSPQRLSLQVTTHGESVTRPLHITIFGQTLAGEETETLSVRSVLWIMGKAFLTTQKTFRVITRIEVSGLAAEDELVVETAGQREDDISLLLPLWGQIPSKKRAEVIVKKNIIPEGHYCHPNGLSFTPGPWTPGDSESGARISLIWNQLIIEGLLAYGFRKEAAGLFEKLMDGMVQSLRQQHAFYPFLQAAGGAPVGERNRLDGLAPIGLFLEVLGVQLLTGRSVIVKESNPFPWPVTVKFRGLCLTRHEKFTRVTFADGQTIQVPITGGAQLVTLD
jgi:hypothetical protein